VVSFRRRPPLSMVTGGFGVPLSFSSIAGSRRLRCDRLVFAAGAARNFNPAVVTAVLQR
jgi:hypothetical protein